MAVALLNRGDEPVTITVTWEELSLNPSILLWCQSYDNLLRFHIYLETNVTIRDLWNRKDVGEAMTKFSMKVIHIGR